MSMSSKDLDLIEKMVDRSNSDLAVAIARSFEKLEYKMEAVGKSIHIDLVAVVESGTITRANKKNDTDKRKEAR